MAFQEYAKLPVEVDVLQLLVTNFKTEIREEVVWFDDAKRSIFHHNIE